MKSKLNIRKYNDTTVVEFYKLKKPYDFRYGMISGALSGFSEAIIFIDTNTRIKKPELAMEAYFDEHNIEYEMFKINETEKRVLGILLNSFRKPKPKLTEKFIMAKITPETFTKKFFEEYVSDYDIAMGLGAKISIQDMARDYRENVQDLFFNKEFFDEFIYDSIVFLSNRNTMDTKEMALKTEKDLLS